MVEAPPSSDAQCGVMTILGTEPAGTADILVTVVAVHSILLMKLSSRRIYSGHWALRFFFFGLSAVYSLLMTYVLSYLTTNVWCMDVHDQTWLLLSVVLIQFIKEKADMAALAISAVSSPAARDDDINSLRVRPSMDSLIYSFWVAGLILYNISSSNDDYDYTFVILVISPLWVLGAFRTVLRYVAFQRATVSWGLGHNVQLIDGYIAQLQAEQLQAEQLQVEHLQEEQLQEEQLQAEQLQEEHLQVPAPVPRLIVTGESRLDVEESPVGYRVKRSALDDPQSTMLITLDRVWCSVSDPLLGQQRFRDLCLSFSLFKCLRRRFAGYPLTEAGSNWAFRFVRDGLLGREDDHERIFNVIASELTFACDFYYSHLPLPSLGTLTAALYFLLSVLIFVLLGVQLLIALVLFQILPAVLSSIFFPERGVATPGSEVLAAVLTVVMACTEIKEMVASVRSRWTSMSLLGHYIRCHNSCARGILSCLLRCCPAPTHWTDKFGQIDLLPVKKSLCKQLYCSLIRRNDRKVRVPPEMKAAVLRALKTSGGQLTAGTAAVQRRCQSFRQDISWACLGGDLTTTTDAILVWCITTCLFHVKCGSPSPRASSSSSSPTRTANSNMVVAVRLSRYCAYLVVEAPHLLPDNAAWTNRRYKEVKEKIEAVLTSWSGCAERELEGGIYEHLIHCIGSDSSHEVLRKGSKLGKQLVDEAATQGSGEEEAGDRDGDEATVWELLAEFWSEMVLYLAPSDNVKGHIEVLQHGVEFITLLWALLLHAGITSRPGRHVPEA